MTTDDLRDLVLEVLGEIAPEADASTLDATEDLRDELDLDSMDELTMITELSERLGIDVPEADYPRLRSLDGAVEYLAGRLAAA